MAKLRVIADDDGLPNGDSHHLQLRRTWRFLLGEEPASSDAFFSNLDVLRHSVMPRVSKFIETSRDLYPKSLGPWLVVEGLAHNWIGALQEALSPHFPGIDRTDYFIHNYASSIEVQHAAESLRLVCKVVAERPELADETIRTAEVMARSLDGVWDDFAELLAESAVKTSGACVFL